MLNFRKKKKEERELVTYKNYLPAEVIDVEKRGRKLYLLLRWSNFHTVPKWVRADMCKPYTPEPKEKKSVFTLVSRGKAELNWFEKFIVKLQNWWYGRKD